MFMGDIPTPGGDALVWGWSEGELQRANGKMAYHSGIVLPGAGGVPGARLRI